MFNVADPVRGVLEFIWHPLVSHPPGKTGTTPEQALQAIMYRRGGVVVTVSTVIARMSLVTDRSQYN